MCGYYKCQLQTSSSNLNDEIINSKVSSTILPENIVSESGVPNIDSIQAIWGERMISI
jgi:hypothetical protein